MMIRVERRTTVAEFLAEMRRAHGDLRSFRAYVRRHHGDLEAALDLEEYEYYVDRPELHSGTMERALALIPVTRGALSVFTKQRLALLETLADGSYGSVRQLAARLRRDVHNVHEDLRLLRRLGVIEFDRGPRRRLSPRLAGDSIRIEIGRPSSADRKINGRGRGTEEAEESLRLEDA